MHVFFPKSQFNIKKVYTSKEMKEFVLKNNVILMQQQKTQRNCAPTLGTKISIRDV